MAGRVEVGIVLWENPNESGHRPGRGEMSETKAQRMKDAECPNCARPDAHWYISCDGCYGESEGKRYLATYRHLIQTLEDVRDFLPANSDLRQQVNDALATTPGGEPTR